MVSRSVEVLFIIIIIVNLAVVGMHERGQWNGTLIVITVLLKFKLP